MRVFSSLAVAVVVSAAAGAVMPERLMRASPSHAVHTPSNDDFFFDWDFESFLEDLTGAPPVTTVQYSSTTTLSTATNADDSMAAHSPKVAHSSEISQASTYATHIQTTKASATTVPYVSFNIFIS
jgi:hypothetical protein